ncbi:hypothetical protein NL524_05685 [Klebsiella pneumoniae]|nr:hypothetical protein [Klebsiella pneumoniae]MCP6712860.1 hypothetical protein [Klebsiella pneumoniae]
MNIETVNELIASLESAGELSIREQKFLKLAKAFKQMAAENVALKLKGRELLNEASKVYQKYNATIDFYSGDFMDGQTLHEFQLVLDADTPATDRIVAEAEACGVEKAIAHLEKKFSNIGVQIMNLQWLADSLREGADK